MDGVESGIKRDVKATNTRNKINAESSLGEEAGDNRLAVINIRNRTHIRSGLTKNTKDDRLAIIGIRHKTNTKLGLGKNAKNDGLVIINDRLAAKEDRFVAGDNDLTIDNDGSATDIG